MECVTNTGADVVVVGRKRVAKTKTKSSRTATQDLNTRLHRPRSIHGVVLRNSMAFECEVARGRGGEGG